LADYFEEAAQITGTEKAKSVGNWIVNDLLRELGNAKISLAESKVTPGHIAALVKLVDVGLINSNSAKEVFVRMFETGGSPGVIIDELGIRAVVSDPNELETWCRDAIAANAKAVAEFKSGKESALNAFKGPVMKAAKGKANPKLVDETLRRLLAAV
jgi:aspartyl-tRNA(Asn)/glutamyl-tRNA(Gln) amidotransferase subunit B